ncbi:MAG: hypothetical protein JNM63_01465 [Spirochaetia bacterium]|nr:hypothetical protein [Spirochaetia bacterium]
MDLFKKSKTSSKVGPADRIAELEKRVEELTRELLHERKSNDMFERLMKFKTKEIEQKNQIIQSLEIVAELGRKELIELHEINRAYEVVEEMMENELREDKALAAKEIFEEFTKRKIIPKELMTIAEEALNLFSKKRAPRKKSS